MAKINFETIACNLRSPVELISLCIWTGQKLFNKTVMHRNIIKAAFKIKLEIKEQLFNTTCRIQNPDIPRAGWVGAPGGAARRGRAKFGANRTIHPKNPPKNRRKVAWAFLQKHKQAKSYLKNDGGTKAGVDPPLITGASTVYQRLISRTACAFPPWLLTSGPTPFCFCKPISCKACLGTNGGTKSAFDPFLRTGSPAVYPRDNKRAFSLAADQ